MDSDLKISIIVAAAENGVIGIGGELPWDLKADLKRFAGLTKNHAVIVGRKTHELILKRLGHPLNGRTTIVITGQNNYKVLNGPVIVVHSWEKALSLAELSDNEVFVIGGAEIYKLALPYANTLYLTRIQTRFEGDTFFPKINMNEWEEVSTESHAADEKNSHDFTFVTLKRKPVSKQFVNIANARLDEQRQVMEEILKRGLCPFCPEHLQKFHKNPVLRGTAHWFLTENQWPYENTKVHLLAIYKHHAESLSELDSRAGEELLALAQWTEQTYKLSGGALTLGMRFGDPGASGATVRHLHAQFVSAAVTDRNDPAYRPVRFRAG